MLQYYLGSLIVGGLLIAASIVLGSGDTAVDIDADGDFDKDVDFTALDGETAAWLPFLSMRFWTFGSASFGLTGVLLEGAGMVGLGSPPSMVTAVVSGGVGLVVGWITAIAFEKLKKENITGDIGMRQIKGSEATVMLKIRSDRTGKIRALVDGQAVDLLARSLDEGELPRGEKVLVVDLQDGTALVTPMRELSSHSI